ncbi:MAG: trypsin-like serine protease [Anaerolineae bacterium]|nr:trypsin-like serine protease [Anaerolineae bacterium]
MVTASANAITFGVPDDGAHPYVGTLLFVQNGEGYYSCSGTLLAPTVMLTAGHCVEEFGNVNDVTYVRFEEDALAGRGDYGTTQEWLDAEWILADEVIPHPQYNDFAEFPLTYDAGLVILSEPVVMAEYGVLPPEGFLETVSKKDTFTAVGYGMQGYINPFYSDIYARYKGTVSLIELRSHLTGGQSAKFTNNPGNGTGSGGTCFGDSGGPVFYDDSNMIVAVVSWGNTPCIGVDFQFRIDTPVALDFIYENWQ